MVKCSPAARPRGRWPPTKARSELQPPLLPGRQNVALASLALGKAQQTSESEPKLGFCAGSLHPASSSASHRRSNSDLSVARQQPRRLAQRWAERSRSGCPDPSLCSSASFRRRLSLFFWPLLSMGSEPSGSGSSVLLLCCKVCSGMFSASCLVSLWSHKPSCQPSAPFLSVLQHLHKIVSCFTLRSFEQMFACPWFLCNYPCGDEGSGTVSSAGVLSSFILSE